MDPNLILRLFACLALLLLTEPLLATDLTGKVVGVHDGDTLTLLVSDGSRFKPVKVRLAEIDTPESKQPYGERAKQALSDLAFGKQTRVVVQDTDKYGRTVGRVYVGSLDVNAELVKRGATWVYRQYSSDPSLNHARTASEGGATRPVGTAGRATLRALGLAARNLQHRFGSDDSCAGGFDRRPGGRQRWFHLRR